MSVEAPLSKSAYKSRLDILSLNKNRKKPATEKKRENRISTIVIQDESFDSLKQFITCRRGNWKHVSTSPIVIDDSFEAPPNDVSYIKKTQSPSKQKCVTPERTNVDLNITQKTGLIVDSTNGLRPSPGGWSPAQNIKCASPKFTPTPFRSEDIANESLEECSIKKIHQSHQDILDELYGDAWRSIPTLFKKKQQKRDADLEGISKKLNFFDNNEDNSDIFDSEIQNHCNDRTNGFFTPKSKLQNTFFDNERPNTDFSHSQKVILDREIPKTELKKVILDSKRPTTDVKKKIFDDNESDKENSDLFDTDINNFYNDKCFTPKADLKTGTRTKKKLYTEKNFDTPEIRRMKRELLNFTEPKPKSKPTENLNFNFIKNFYPYKCFTPEADLKTGTQTKKKHYTEKNLDTLEVERVKGDLLNCAEPKPTENFNFNFIKSFNPDKYFTPKADLKTGTQTKKKHYTEKNFETPEVERIKGDLLNFTEPKPKSKPTTDRRSNGIKSVKQLSEVEKPLNVTKLSFMGSLADNVPTWRCDSAALDYKTKYKMKRDQLARRLFLDFNKMVFDGCLDNDMPVTWDSKLRTTAGTTTNRLIKTSNLVKIRVSSIKLSSKVIDGPQRLRDTLVHEMCHAATWIIDHEIKAGHGPLWKKWAKRALSVFPELEEISRCHTLQIHFKYSYKCQQCGYTINRHSKSIDITKKCCGYCRGKFVVIVNKKTKDGVVVSTPAKHGEANDFALYVKQNYARVKDGTKTHAQVMKILGEQYSLRKKV